MMPISYHLARDLPDEAHDLCSALRDSGVTVVLHGSQTAPEIEGGICHLHGFPSLDAQWVRQFEHMHRRHIPRIAHFWGGDVRGQRRAAVANPYANWLGGGRADDDIRRDLRALSQHVPSCIVPHYELVTYVAKYFRRIYVLPYAWPEDAVQSPQRTFHHTPTVLRIGYSKSTLGEAGTQYLMDVLQSLNDRCRPLTIRCIPVHSAHSLRDGEWEVDVVVDQLHIGEITPLAVAAMAHGYTVLSYIREDLKLLHGPELPVVSASPASLLHVLGQWIEDPSIGRQMSLKGPLYVSRVHHARRVSASLLWIYLRETQEQLKRHGSGVKHEVVDLHDWPGRRLTADEEAHIFVSSQ